MKYEVSIIVVNYNGSKYLPAFFESLNRLSKYSPKFELIFVDNNSTDRSTNLAKQLSKNIDIKIIHSDENLGFAAGNNLGVKSSKGKYIVFLNNDTTIDKKWLIELVKAKENEENIGIVNSKLIFYPKFVKVQFKTKDKIVIKNKFEINDEITKVPAKFTHNLLYSEDELICFGNSFLYLPIDFNNLNIEKNEFNISVGKDISMKNNSILINDKEFKLDKLKSKFKISTQFIESIYFDLIQNAGSSIDKRYNGFDIGFGEVDSNKFNSNYSLTNACGASMLISRKDFDELGGFDDRFFMYYEDTDLSFRLRNQLKKKIIYCHSSIVRHVHTGSSTEWSAFFIYYVYRNRLLFILKNFSFSIFIKQYFFSWIKFLEFLFSNNSIKKKTAMFKSIIYVTTHFISYTRLG